MSTTISTVISEMQRNGSRTGYAPGIRVVHQASDFRSIADLRQAETIWYEEWKEQGQKDEGSCTGGKGLQVWYIGPRKRKPTLRTVVAAPPVQGNMSAYRSHAPALEYLESVGVEASYYDGWMD